MTNVLVVFCMITIFRGGRYLSISVKGKGGKEFEVIAEVSEAAQGLGDVNGSSEAFIAEAYMDWK